MRGQATRIGALAGWILLLLGTVVPSSAEPPRLRVPTTTYYLRTDFNQYVGGGYLNPTENHGLEDPTDDAEFGCEGDCATGTFSGVTCPTGPKCARVNHVKTKDQMGYAPDQDCNGPPFGHMGVIDVVDVTSGDTTQAWVGLASMVPSETVGKMRQLHEDIEILAASPTDRTPGVDHKGKVVQILLHATDHSHFTAGIKVRQTDTLQFSTVELAAGVWFYTVLKIRHGPSAEQKLWQYDASGNPLDGGNPLVVTADTVGNDQTEEKPRQKVGGETQLADYDVASYNTYHDDWYIADSNVGPQHFDFHTPTTCVEDP